jgi:hypothetical protein
MIYCIFKCIDYIRYEKDTHWILELLEWGGNFFFHFNIHDILGGIIYMNK